MPKFLQEYLLYNKLDRDFIEFLRPLHLLQSLYFLPKYRIDHGFITPYGILVKALSFLGTSLFISLHLYRLDYTILSTSTKIEIDNFFPIFNIFNFAIYTVAFGLMFVTNMMQSLNYINLVLKLQSAHRTFKFKTKGMVRLICWNWFHSVIYIPLYIFVIVLVSCILKVAGFFEKIYMMSYIYFDASIVDAYCMIKLVNFELDIWVEEVACFSKLCLEFQDLRFYMEDKNSHWTRMFKAYSDILAAFETYKKIYRFPVRLFLSKLIIPL